MRGGRRVAWRGHCACAPVPFLCTTWSPLLLFIIPRPHAFDLPSFASMGIVLRGDVAHHAMLKP